MVQFALFTRPFVLLNEAKQVEQKKKIYYWKQAFE